MTEITVPNSIAIIGTEAFCRCLHLTGVTIPDSVTSISGSAFCGCYRLTVHAPRGSYAERYAKDYNIKFAAD